MIISTNDPKNPVEAGDVMYLQFDDQEYPRLQKIRRCYERPDLKLSHLEERRNNAAYWYSYFENKEKRK